MMNKLNSGFRHIRCSVMVAMLGLCMPTLSHTLVNADEYPNKPIRLVVPYPPGGGTDAVARILQPKLQVNLKQPVIIDNKSGAGGTLGTNIVAKSTPDGYTVLFTLSSHTINPAIYNKLPFDTIKDFAPIGMVASLPQILAVSPSVSVKNLNDLFSQAKANPSKFPYASVGNGSPGHLAGELMRLRTDIQFTHIPYRGGGPAVTDVISGQVPLLWVSIPAAAQFIKTGKLRALAVSTLKRSALFPDVPTMQESGIADFEVDAWYAMLAPARTPQLVIDRLNKALNSALQDPFVRAQLLDQGVEAMGGAPETLGKIIQNELPKWDKLAKSSNIKAD